MGLMFKLIQFNFKNIIVSETLTIRPRFVEEIVRTIEPKKIRQRFL